MKKKAFKIMIIGIILIVFGLVGCGLVDYLRYKEGELPIFAKPLDGYWDGGSVVYYGVGYKILKCHTLSGDESMYFGFYNMKYQCINDGKKIEGR